MLSEIAKKAVVSKLIAEGATNITDAEIQRVMSGCVMPERMAQWAKMMRDSGDLQLSDVRTLE